MDSTKKYFSVGDYDKTLHYAQLAEDLSVKQNDKEGLRYALYYKAGLYFDTQKLALADSVYQVVGDMSIEARDTSLLIKVLNGQGNILALQNDGSTALLKYYEALELARNGDPDTYYGIRSNMALAQLKNEQYEEALSNLLLTSEHFKKKGDKSALAIVNNNIGELYRENLNDFQMAKKHFYKAIALNHEVDSDYHLSKNFNNLGLCFERLNQKDSALYYLQKSLLLKKQLGDVGGTAICHYNI
ncbi:MAG: tetratricopeptide repeat protein, partial [Owenweeksia sp.]